ncbi:hypothetical protein [Myxacorys almedinensis]|uniref:General stress protein 17M-like domain-containing protein n=1 Tax=Myxacorys almedinensis A TaxID=2690445 RepID=A0A8J7YZF0_9CYAN|nr:hypothetical protein [Myxacorys almedinensis]NDJ16180.1 hypothetical protein [Myxacorys almedinensis A]
MNYLVAVLSDRIQAEAAYSALEREGLPMNKVAILGRGYKSADEFGLIDPNEQALKQVKLMASWLIPFGFVGGVGFNAITGLDTFAWAGETGSLAIAGLAGAISGGLGSVLVGGGVGLIIGGGDALPYRNRLNAGKYLVVVTGSESLTRKANNILQQYDLENIQGYADSSTE